MLKITTLGELGDALRWLWLAELKAQQCKHEIMNAPCDANYLELSKASEAAEARVAELRAQAVKVDA